MVFLNKIQVAERLQVTTRTIDKWIKEGYFPKGRYVKRRPFGLNEKLKIGGSRAPISTVLNPQLSQTLHPPRVALLHVVAPGGQNVDRPGQRRFPVACDILFSARISGTPFSAHQSLNVDLNPCIVASVPVIRFKSPVRE